MKTRITHTLLVSLLLLVAAGYEGNAQQVDAAYVANSQDNTVSVIGRERMDTLATIPVGGHPTRVAASPDGRRVFIANESSNSVSVIDTATGAVLATLAVGTQPAGLAVSPDNRRLYVVNFGSNNMSVIDIPSATVVDTVPVASSPMSIAYHPQRAELWIGYGRLETALEVRRAADYSVLGSIRNASRFFEFSSQSFTPDGACLWTAENCGCCGRFHKLSGSVSNGTVAIIERDILFDNLGAAYAVVVNPVTARAYLGKSGHCGGTPSAYESGTERRAVLSAIPRAMAVDASRDRLWVALANGSVTVVDMEAMTTVATGRTGGLPEGIALAPFGSTCASAASPYVADSNTVLLDHFDGATSGNIVAFLNDGGPCGPARPSATPNYSFQPGPAGLDRAIALSAPPGAPTGSGSYLKYPGGELLSQRNGTLECWVNLAAYGLYAHQLEFVGECQGDVGGLSITPSGQLRADIWYTIFTPFSFDSGTNIVPLNTWTHIALSWGDAGAKMYINGSLIGTHANTGSFASWFGRDSFFLFLGDGSRVDELRISNIQRTSFNLSAGRTERRVGTYTVNYRYNAAGRYTDQSHPDYTQANPYYGNSIPPGPIFIDAAPGRYRIVTESGGCSVWSGNAASGRYYSSTPAVEFNHEFGQIALYYWDWFTGDNDPSVQSTISVYEVVTDSLTSLTLTPLNPVISSLQSLQFNATGSFATQEPRPLTASDGLIWASSDPSVVTVNASGLAVPIKQGVATISVTVCSLSAATRLVVTNQPPTVATPLVNRAVSPGTEVSWCAEVSGSQPMTFQWQLNGVNLPVANNSCLSISNANQSAAGLYTLIASNAFGVVNSSAALLLTDIKMFAGLIITGPAGAYRIEAREALGDTNSWAVLGTNRVALSEMPFHYFDTNSPNLGRRFYRSIWMP